MGKFDGQVAIVTGAARGVGKASAKMLAKEGCKVMLSDINPGVIDSAKDIMQEVPGAECAGMVVDVSKPDQVDGLVQEPVNQFGRLDIMFNNAGINQAMCEVAETDDSVFDRVININLDVYKRQGVDIAIECTGAEAAMRDAFGSLRKRGMYVQSGLPVGEVTLPAFDWAYRDYNMCGLWCFNTYDFEASVALIASGRIPVEKVVTRVMPVEQTKEAFDILSADKSGQEVKIQISFE